MKDQTILGSEPTQTPIAGVDWAGETEVGEVTLSDQETLVLPRLGPSRVSPLLGGALDGGGPEISPRVETRIPHGLGGFLVRVWSLARSSLLGAVVCGVLGGLLVALALVLGIRVVRAAGTGLEPAQNTPMLLINVHVHNPSGAPVLGARVQRGDRSSEVDPRGFVAFEEPLTEDRVTPRVRFEVVCPAGMRAKEGTRELIIPALASRSTERIERSLTFVCESTRVELSLALRAVGGEAQFWLGHEDLGVTVDGRLEKVVLVDKRSEKVLRAEPVTPSGEKRRPRVTPVERTVVVLDEASRLEHTVKLEWPRRRISTKPRAIPYRL